MRRPLFLLVVVLAAVSAAPVATQFRNVPEEDRFVRLGTRLPPVVPGEGGALFVIAPTQFCADAGFVLELFHHPTYSMVTPAARMIAGPSTCGWKFEDLATGRYTASLHAHPDGPIVATGGGNVVQGSTRTLTVSTVQTEVEGTLRVNGGAPPDGLHLLFRQPGEPWLQWLVPLDANGAYQVALDAKPIGRTICVALERDPPLNLVSVKCREFATGLQRLDIDATMPRGLLRIEIPPVPVAEAGFAFGRITISDSDDPAHGYLTSFRLRRGLRGDHIAELGRDYRIIVSRSDDKTVLATARVPLSNEQTDVRVRLPIEVPPAPR
jgi:hypothetical protein